MTWFRVLTGVEGNFSLASFDFDDILLSFAGDHSLSRKFYKE